MHLKIIFFKLKIALHSIEWAENYKKPNEKKKSRKLLR